jgi:tetratricopeptide (TPR) repeat protein
MAAVALKPQSAGPHHLLGVTFQRQGKLSDAIALLHEAIRLQPEDATIRNSLANAFLSAGKLDAAIDQYRAAIRLAPTYNLPLLNLADILLTRKGEIDQAIAVYRQAIQLDAGYDMAHVHLGFALENRGWADEAVAEYREAIRLNPKCFLAHANLGDALCRRGDFALAVVEFRTAFDLTTIAQRRESLKQQIARTERYKTLALRLPAILRGAEEPSDPAQGLEFAQICHYLKRYAGASRLFTEALAADPKLGDDLTKGARYSAACSAALAAAGQSKDESPLDEAAKTLLRRRACEWLKADYRALATIAPEGPPQYRAQVQQFFQHWTVDPDLAGIRDPAALSRLPEPERKDWQSLWSAVGDLLGQRPTARVLQ